MANHKFSLFLLLTAFSLGCTSATANEDTVCLETKCVVVEVAKTNEERMRGLQFRESLPETSGMLFIFTYPGAHRFWMKDTLISLDMIWMDYHRKIVFIESNVPPCRKNPCPTYGPSYSDNINALYVLEVNAGQAEKLGFELGKILEFNLERK